MEENEYRCASCRNIYEKGWSDKEARKEMQEIWGEVPEQQRAVICDDCFNRRTPQEIKSMGDEYKNSK